MYNIIQSVCVRECVIGMICVSGCGCGELMIVSESEVSPTVTSLDSLDAYYAGCKSVVN